MGIPYSELNTNFSMCAFTQKVRRWCRILNDMNVNYITYANANTDFVCRNAVTIFSSSEREAFFGKDNNWRVGGQYFDQRTDSPGAVEWIRRASIEVTRRKNVTDLILATFGTMHASISTATGLTAIEVGVGYRETFSSFRVFESYTWLSTFLRTSSERVDTLSLYDAVIPICYYDDEFTGPRLRSHPYLAFVGRITESKGIVLALNVLSRSPHLRLKVAGTGNLTPFLAQFSNCSDRVDYLGVLDSEARNHLLSGALALLAPTLYVEPFGSVVVESMFMGTPVITTDHAAMSETVWDGVTGFRCRTIDCFVTSVHNAGSLNRTRIMRYAQSNYRCQTMASRYAEYFPDVLN
jgi:glycosyltransferase involved in cell wall biosynthesis